MDLGLIDQARSGAGRVLKKWDITGSQDEFRPPVYKDKTTAKQSSSTASTFRELCRPPFVLTSCSACFGNYSGRQFVCLFVEAAAV